MANGGKGRTIAIWVVSGLLAALYLMTGGMKLAGADEVIKNFTRFGYPGWFRVLIGIIEIAGGVLLLVPRLAFYAATALGVVMIGAVYTHFTHGEVPQGLFPLILLVVLSYVGYARGQAVR